MDNDFSLQLSLEALLKYASKVLLKALFWFIAAVVAAFPFADLQLRLLSSGSIGASSKKYEAITNVKTHFSETTGSLLELI